MQVLDRGNVNIMKSIREKASKISEARGYTVPNNVEAAPLSAGAAASLQKIREQFGDSDTISTNNMNSSIKNASLSSSKFNLSLEDRLLDSIGTLGVTKEYFNAIQSLFTLYVMGKLEGSVLEKISREDLREIKSILREFRDILDFY